MFNEHQSFTVCMDGIFSSIQMAASHKHYLIESLSYISSLYYSLQNLNSNPNDTDLQFYMVVV